MLRPASPFSAAQSSPPERPLTKAMSIAGPEGWNPPPEVASRYSFSNPGTASLPRRRRYRTGRRFAQRPTDQFAVLVEHQNIGREGVVYVEWLFATDSNQSTHQHNGQNNGSAGGLRRRYLRVPKHRVSRARLAASAELPEFTLAGR
jgi:hypothetical protein